MKFEIDPLDALVADRQFKLLFDAMWEHDCPPRDFQREGCDVNPYSGANMCLVCWRDYTRIQALLDLGLVSKMGEEEEEHCDRKDKEEDSSLTELADSD